MKTRDQKDVDYANRKEDKSSNVVPIGIILLLMAIVALGGWILRGC